MRVHRHPVPQDSWNPNRPLNDLLVEQLNHFIHVARKLPRDVRAALPPVPKHEDTRAAGEFVAAVTKALMDRQQAAGPQLVREAVRQRTSAVLSLAAAEEQEPRVTAGDGAAAKEAAEPVANP